MKLAPLFTVDVGNTRTKFALWNTTVNGDPVFKTNEGRLNDLRPCFEFADSSSTYTYAEEQLSSLEFLKNQKAYWIISSVNSPKESRLNELIRRLRPQDVMKTVSLFDVPLTVQYDCPEKLGIDRAVAAYAGLKLLGLGRPFLTVDVGTAATIDFVDSKGVFRGGAILPGPRLTAEALQAKTASLPLIDDPENEKLAHLYRCVKQHNVLTYPATETQSAIRLGVVYTLVGAIEAFYWQTRRKLLDSGENPASLALVLAGGDAELTKFNINLYFSDLDATLGIVVPRPEVVIEARLVHLGLKSIAFSCKDFLQS